MAESTYKQMASGLWMPEMLAQSPTSDLRQPADWLTNWARGGWVGSPSSHSTSGPDGPMTLAAYYACLRNISEDIAKLPFLIYRRQGRGKERVPEHPVYTLLHTAANRDMTSMTLREVMTHHALAWGNSYAEIVLNGRGVVEALYPIHPSRVWLHRNDEGELIYDVYGSSWLASTGVPIGTPVRLRQEQILHLKGISGDGYLGYSIFRLAALSLGLSLAAEHYGAAFFTNGARPSGILQHPEKLSDVALTHLRDSWQSLYCGPEQAGKPAILEEGMTWHPLAMPPEEAQYLQTRSFQIIEVARWFRMPPHKIQDLVNAHYHNVEQQNTEYVSDTLMPWCVRWEQEVSRKLLVGEPELFAEHLVTGLLRGDMAARASYYQTRFALGTLSPDEIRGLENENELPDGIGQHYYLAANNYARLDAAPGPTPGPLAQPLSPFPARRPAALNGSATGPDRTSTPGWTPGQALEEEDVADF